MEQRFSHITDLFGDTLPDIHVSQSNANSAFPGPNGAILPLEELISASLFSDEQERAYIRTLQEQSYQVPTQNLHATHSHAVNGSIVNMPAMHAPNQMQRAPIQSAPPPPLAEPLMASPHERGTHKPLQHKTIPAQRLKKPGKSRSFFWALTGFILGVVFWHFVGFWDFVNGTLLTTPQSSRLGKEIMEEKKIIQKSQNPDQTNAQQAYPQEESFLATSPAENHTACVDLVLDRDKKETISQTCEPGQTFKHNTQSANRMARIDSSN